VTYAFLLREDLGEWVTPRTLMVYPHFRQGAHMYGSFSKCRYMFSSLRLKEKMVRLSCLPKALRRSLSDWIEDIQITLNYSKTSMFQTTTLRRKTVQPFLPLPMGLSKVFPSKPKGARMR